MVSGFLCAARRILNFSSLWLLFLRTLWFLEDYVLSTLASIFVFFAVPILRRILPAIPPRVYLVMDGNRRWAKARGLPTRDGHSAGYLTLQRLLKMLSGLGVKEVVVYAFAIPNFKRSAEEKSFLMDLATDKLREMQKRGDIVDKYDLKVRVVGDKSRLPPKLVKVALEVEAATAHRETCTLAIAFAYAARQEIQMALGEAVAHGDTSSESVGKRLWVPPPADSELPPLLVRTSGETRYSDFLVWQSGCAPLVFQNVNWPDYRPWHLAVALVRYARQSHAAADAARRCATRPSSPPIDEPVVKQRFH
eukprot:Hpha_TRINITY_DN30303_c0_g1::TRINITY_DN30303_c0_g1_i1::g.147114::m.147114/K11778/DHDDS, RER2, SRT1; ditrans,polycis-polyprenyl diphosphate synthase